MSVWVPCGLHRAPRPPRGFLPACQGRLHSDLGLREELGQWALRPVRTQAGAGRWAPHAARREAWAAPCRSPSEEPPPPPGVCCPAPPRARGPWRSRARMTEKLCWVLARQASVGGDARIKWLSVAHASATASGWGPGPTRSLTLDRSPRWGCRARGGTRVGLMASLGGFAGLCLGGQGSWAGVPALVRDAS